LFRGARVVALSVVVCATAVLHAAPLPPLEQLLPDETLALVATPDFAKLRGLWEQSALSQLWHDAEMKPFRDYFLKHWTEEFVQPLEAELGVRLADYLGLPQGQVTLAVLRCGWEDQPGQAPALLLLLDVRERADQLRKHLADVRQKWVASDKPLRLEKVRDVEFAVLTVRSNDMPRALRPLLPGRAEGGQPADRPAAAPAAQTVLVIGQFESLLLVSSSLAGVEKTVARLTGGNVPTLAEVAGFDADRLRQFRDAPLFAWVNVRALVDIVGRSAASRSAARPGEPPPLDPKLLLTATGVSGLKTLAFSFRPTGEGSLLELTLGAPAPERTGLFKLLSAEPKDAAPPAFVPADAVKFQRMRLDGQKTWAALEKMAGDISPQWLSVLNLFLQTADKAGKERDPAFDVKKDLIGILGDDLISWQKAPRGSLADGNTDGPSIWLVGSTSAEKLALSLRNMFAAMGAPADTSQERAFLGRKIYTAPLPTFAPPEDPKAPPPTVHYAASGGYVAFAKDVTLLEEYLRAAENPPKPLRDTAGLAAALQQAGGAGSGWVSFENEAETLRATFEALRQHAAPLTNASLGSAWSGAAGIAPDGLGLPPWFDFSLLPPFEKIAKYFHITVTAGAATAEGITFRVFRPTPPGLKK